MSDGPYTAEYSETNYGVTVYNVKGPGIDRLVVDPYHDSARNKARDLAEDLNIAYAAGAEQKK